MSSYSFTDRYNILQKLQALNFLLYCTRCTGLLERPLPYYRILNGIIIIIIIGCGGGGGGSSSSSSSSSNSSSNSSRISSSNSEYKPIYQSLLCV